MRTRTFRTNDVYEPQDGDWFEWRHRKYTRKDGLWVAPYVGGHGCDGLNADQFHDILNAGLITIRREVPDEPGEWEAHDIKRLANSDESADGLTSTVERVWLRKVKP